MLARIFRRIFENAGAGPKLRDDVVPWNKQPLATPAAQGAVPSGGTAGQLLTISADGKSVKWMNAPSSHYVGKMEFTAFSPDQLAAYLPGWYFMNGDQFALTSAQGLALKSLPSAFKTRWGIVAAGTLISLPNFFHADGRGYFVRAADGTVRKAGGTSDDTMRKFTGTTAGIAAVFVTNSNSGSFGVVRIGDGGAANVRGSGAGPDYGNLYIDSSLLGPNYSGTETAPLARFMTPIIHLGV